MKLTPIHKILIHEGVDATHVEEVKAMMMGAGVFTEPIVVDKQTLIVLDGHHRLQSCKELGATKIPCMLVDYLGNDTITVYPRRKNIPVSKEKVVAMGLSDKTYPVKTTKHVIPHRETGLSIQLSELGIPSDQSESTDVPFWKDAKDATHGSIAVSYAAGEDVILDKQFIAYECEVDLAHVCMLVKTHLISPQMGTSLLEGLRWIQRQHKRGAYALNPALEDVHSNIEQTLISRLGIATGGYLHLGIARNDQVYADTRMWMREHILGMCDMLLVLISGLVEKAALHTKTIMPGYTHLRISQPITFGHWLTAKAYHVIDDIKNILNIFDMVDKCPLGIFEMAGTHLPIDRQYIARLLGFSEATSHSLYTANQRGEQEAKLLHELTMNELILFSSHEFQLITLGTAYTTGGTAQPNLTNPDTLEVVRANMARIHAASLETVMIMDSLPSGFNRDTQVTKKILFDSVELMESTLPVVTGILMTIEPNTKRMEELANIHFSTSPDITIQLSVCGKISFREAYQVVKTIIKKGVISSFIELTPQMVNDTAMEVLKKPIVVTQEQINEVATARACVNAHTSFGGPAPGQVKNMIKKIKKQLRILQGNVLHKKQKLSDSHTLLRRTVNKTIKTVK